MTTIEVTVSRQGEITLVTKGFSGSACRAASRDLEQALGLVVAERPTAELYASVPVASQQLAAGESPGGEP